MVKEKEIGIVCWVNFDTHNEKTKWRNHKSIFEFLIEYGFRGLDENADWNSDPNLCRTQFYWKKRVNYGL